MVKKITKELTKKEREALSIVGRINGRKSFEKNGRKHMSLIGRKGAEARWGKKTEKKVSKSTNK